MNVAGIEFPEQLIAALRNNNLVVFAGAGVSMGEPARLPDFKTLAERIAEGTGQVVEPDELLDRFLGRLRHRGVNVHTRAVENLQRDGLAPTQLHRDLLRLYSNVEDVRVVTTNFDLLFTQAAIDVFTEVPEVFRAPALPLGHNFKGIIHVHGAVSHPKEIVLTDADFGRAYLTEGWASRFLTDLFRHFTVLFVGYRHEDTIVSYLARALPAGGKGCRFALIQPTDDAHRWKALGIEPIVFPQEHSTDFEALNRGVQRLANRVRMNVLDWQTEISGVARNGPPLPGEEADMLQDALRVPAYTRFFTEAAQLPEWIEWLDKRNCFDTLFNSASTLDDRDSILARWLARQFAIDHAQDVLLLITRRGMHLNPLFWHELIRAITSGQQINEKSLSRWVSLLVATVPYGGANQYHLRLLAERCCQQNLMASLLSIFEAMTFAPLVIKQGFSWHTDSPKIDVERAWQNDHNTFKGIWTKQLEPNLSELAEPLLRIAIRRLEEQHSTLRAWDKAKPKWDGLSFGRSAIEPHDQDRHPKAIDAVIDIARDCLEWLASNEHGLASYWCTRLEASEAPLSRRLAVHTLSKRTDLTAEDKIDWLLTHIGLHNTATHHEVFQAMRLAYSEVGPTHRARVVEAILNYRAQASSEGGNG